MSDPCPRCTLLHAKWVPCSVAIEAEKPNGVDMSSARSVSPPAEFLDAVKARLAAGTAEQKPERTFRKKKKMSAAGRKRLSEKAKAWWDAKRAEKAAEKPVAD